MKRLILALALICVLGASTVVVAAPRGYGSTYGAYRGRSSYQSFYRPSRSYGRISSRSSYRLSPSFRVRSYHHYGSYAKPYYSRSYYRYAAPHYPRYSQYRSGIGLGLYRSGIGHGYGRYCY